MRPEPSPRDRSRAGRSPAGDRTIVPVVAEELVVGRQQVETGRIRVRKTVRARRVVVDEPTVRQQVTVVRVPLDRPVDAPPPVREEGDTLVVPVVEETLVVQKQLVLKEEIRITRRRVETRDPRRFTLRAERAVVERVRPRDRRTPPSDGVA